MDKLFSTKRDFKIVRLREKDARGLSDHLRDFSNLILQNEPMYPRIGKWLSDKVIPGIKSSQRAAYVGYVDGLPGVSAVVKSGESSKFCHLKIREDLQDKHLGEAFFCLMGLYAKASAKEIHFTLPESVWEGEKEFFRSFGFDKAQRAGQQYRLFEDELRCSASFGKVWRAIVEKLPKVSRAFSLNGRSFDTRMLLSIKPEHAIKVLLGKKKVEIRRKFSNKWSGQRVSIYASRPQSSVVGDALIRQVVFDNPECIWDRFGRWIGCTKRQFDSYAGSVTELYAIVLEDVVPYERSISLAEASQAVDTSLRPPQSYCALENSKGWAEAVSMGAILQRGFRDIWNTCV